MSSREPGAQRASQAAGKPAVRHRKAKLLAFVLLCALPVGGAALLSLRTARPVALLIYLVASLVSFGLYWRDKRQARQAGQRTPEKILHAVELLGGWPGALLAQQIFRHKTRKLSYQVVFWLIVAVHEVGWLYLFTRHAL